MSHSFCPPHSRLLNQLSGEEKMAQRLFAERHLETAGALVRSHLASFLPFAETPQEVTKVLAEVVVLACVCRCDNSAAVGSVLYYWPQEVLLQCLGETLEHPKKKLKRSWGEFAQEFYDGTLSAASRSIACDVIEYLLQKSLTMHEPEIKTTVAHCIQCLTPTMRKSLNSQRRRGATHISG